MNPVANASSRVDAEAAEEADEERLADREAVDRERDEHDEEEQRAEHDVGPHREIDADGPGGGPDGHDPRRLEDGRDQRDGEQRADVVAIPVDPLVGRAHRTLDPGAAQERHRKPQEPPHPRREEHDPAEHGQADEQAFDPEIRADVVAADREHEPDRCEHERHRAADRPLEQHRAGDRRAEARVPARRLVDPRRVAADGGRQHLPDRVGDVVGARQPAERVLDPARAQQQLPAPGLRRHRDHRQHRREGEPAEARPSR